MKCKILIFLMLALYLAGCTTILAKEVNRDRVKNGSCEPPLKSNCVNLIDAAIADVVIATYVASEIIEQIPDDKPLPKIDTGDIQCAVSEQKVCSVSSGCQCEPASLREQAL